MTYTINLWVKTANMNYSIYIKTLQVENNLIDILKYFLHFISQIMNTVCVSTDVIIADKSIQTMPIVSQIIVEDDYRNWRKGINW